MTVNLQTPTAAGAQPLTPRTVQFWLSLLLMVFGLFLGLGARKPLVLSVIS